MLITDLLSQTGVAALAGFIVLACAILFFFYGWRKRPRNSTSSKFLFRGGSSQQEAEMDAHLQTHLFSYDELMEATNYFDTSRELGDGGFGTVYKGIRKHLVLVKKKKVSFLSQICLLS